MGYFCANFSLPRPLCSRHRPDVRGRQTDRQTSDAHHRLIPPKTGHKDRRRRQTDGAYTIPPPPRHGLQCKAILVFASVCRPACRVIPQRRLQEQTRGTNLQVTTMHDHSQKATADSSCVSVNKKHHSLPSISYTTSTAMSAAATKIVSSSISS